ncbi:hypothetical protein SOCEGT47_076840 [Sorangium cellulosum]|uniref:DUF4879 domain-containing protein n=1 Tax=Sorangium cellulosum TaxID=56 RepID=A0A4P2QBQ0_SORCE|nr:DUF4879 domain-containing protein [Sorangium cellulosum]AUX27105.1 hypothetical protein SOCEGT47_076840 [Sorangium cellulosum]
MKKALITLVAVTLLLIQMTASAQPAAPLSNVQIIGVASDGTGSIWENIPFTQTTAITPLTGTTGYIAIYVQGTQLGSFPAIRNGGDIITTTQARPTDYVQNSMGYIIGAIHYRTFDLADVTTGQLSATSINYYPPNQSVTDFLYVHVD